MISIFHQKITEQITQMEATATDLQKEEIRLVKQLLHELLQCEDFVEKILSKGCKTKFTAGDISRYIAQDDPDDIQLQVKDFLKYRFVVGRNLNRKWKIIGHLYDFARVSHDLPKLEIIEDSSGHLKIVQEKFNGLEILSLLFFQQTPGYFIRKHNAEKIARIITRNIGPAIWYYILESLESKKPIIKDTIFLDTPRLNISLLGLACIYKQPGLIKYLFEHGVRPNMLLNPSEQLELKFKHRVAPNAALSSLDQEIKTAIKRESIMAMLSGIEEFFLSVAQSYGMGEEFRIKTHLLPLPSTQQASPPINEPIDAKGCVHLDPLTKRALLEDSMELIESIIKADKRKVNIDELFAKGKNLLHCACLFGAIKIVKYFLENRNIQVDVNFLSQEEDGKHRPIYFALRSNHPNTVPILALLVIHGAHILANETNDNADDIVIEQVKIYTNDNADDISIEQAQYVPQIYRRSFLHVAVEFLNLPGLQYLLDQSEAIDKIDIRESKYQHTALQDAIARYSICSKLKLPIITLLLDREANPDLLSLYNSSIYLMSIAPYVRKERIEQNILANLACKIAIQQHFPIFIKYRDSYYVYGLKNNSWKLVPIGTDAAFLLSNRPTFPKLKANQDTKADTCLAIHIIHYEKICTILDKFHIQANRDDALLLSLSRDVPEITKLLIARGMCLDTNNQLIKPEKITIFVQALASYYQELRIQANQTLSELAPTPASLRATLPPPSPPPLQANQTLAQPTPRPEILSSTLSPPPIQPPRPPISAPSESKFWADRSIQQPDIEGIKVTDVKKGWRIYSAQAVISRRARYFGSTIHAEQPTSITKVRGAVFAEAAMAAESAASKKIQKRTEQKTQPAAHRKLLQL